MAKEEDIINEAKERYKESCQGWDDIYKEAVDDLKFVYDIDNGQWPESAKSTRKDRPILTINKLQKTLRRIRGDHKLNPTGMKVLPVDDLADVDKAELYNGIIREIEYLSNADIAYDTAYMHAISSSIGFFRIITKYVDNASFDQDIAIKRIINPFSVHFDPYATEFELEDAKYCFIEELVDKKIFKKKYPKADATNFESNSVAELFGEWIQGDKIRVAEYFYKEPIKQKIVLLKTGEIIPIEKNITIEAIKHLGGEITREREVEKYIVKWCKMNGHQILEETTWPTEDIPIIPMFGDEVVVDGKRNYISLARGAKDPQRMYNYWASAATETVALAPKMPFIIDHRQIKGFEREWQEANIKNRMYVRYNAIAGLQKPSREPQGQVPSAIMSMMQQTAYDVEDHLGQYESSKGEASNERSGKAIMARVQQSDKGTFLFVDNATRAKVASGKQIIRLIPKIYDTKRALRIRGEDGIEKSVTVNNPVLGEDGNIRRDNDLTVGKYDLIATAGASYSSKRQEMIEYMTQVMQYAPQLANIIAPLVIKYSDYPGAKEIYAELQKAVVNQAAQGQE